MGRCLKILFTLASLALPFCALALEYPFGSLKDNPSPCEYIKVAYAWGLGLVGTLAVTVIAYGGFLYMVGKVEQGRDYITSAFLGVLLLFGSYLILYTINPELAKLRCETIKMMKFEERKVSPTSNQDQTGALSGLQSSTGGKCAAGDYEVRVDALDGAERCFSQTSYDFRTKLDQAKIGIKDECPPNQSTGCVALGGVKETSINRVLDLANKAGVENVYITGGNEGCGTIHKSGTVSHCTGDKIDLAMDPELTAYITNNYSKAGTWKDGTQLYRAPDGTIFAKESNHWDVSFSQN
jgi:hypothetical protein